MHGRVLRKRLERRAEGHGYDLLILIGALPTAYAHNRAVPESQVPAFIAATAQVKTVFDAHAGNQTMPIAGAKDKAADALKLRKFDGRSVFAALSALSTDVAAQVQSYGSLAKIPAAAVENVRNEMFIVSEAIRLAPKTGVTFTADETTRMGAYKKGLTRAPSSSRPG
jgi:PiT family inorganic phosphate transporter